MYNTCIPGSSSINLFELNITLVLHERGVPGDITLVIRQLCVELGMGDTVKLLAFDLTIFMTLIGIEEPSKPNVRQSILSFSLGYSPKSSSRVQTIGNAEPVRRS
jgi:hypothetical protein